MNTVESVYKIQAYNSITWQYFSIKVIAFVLA